MLLRLWVWTCTKKKLDSICVMFLTKSLQLLTCRPQLLSDLLYMPYNKIPLIVTHHLSTQPLLELRKHLLCSLGSATCHVVAKTELMLRPLRAFGLQESSNIECIARTLSQPLPIHPAFWSV